MNNIRLLPVVILAIAALLVLKTVGLVTNGGYVLTGVSVAQAAGGGGGGGSGEGSGETVTLPSEPTIEDHTPTVTDGTPTLGEKSEAASGGGGHGAPAAEGDTAAEGEHATETAEHGAEPANPIAEENACAPRPVAAEGEADTSEGELLVIPANCPPLTDALPQVLTPGLLSARARALPAR